MLRKNEKTYLVNGFWDKRVSFNLERGDLGGSRILSTNRCSTQLWILFVWRSICTVWSARNWQLRALQACLSEFNCKGNKNLARSFIWHIALICNLLVVVHAGLIWWDVPVYWFRGQKYEHRACREPHRYAPWDPSYPVPSLSQRCGRAERKSTSCLNPSVPKSIKSIRNVNEFIRGARIPFGYFLPGQRNIALRSSGFREVVFHSISISSHFVEPRGTRKETNRRPTIWSETSWFLDPLFHRREAIKREMV